MSTPDREKLDRDFLRMHAHYLDTAETKWPFVNSARAIGEVSRRVCSDMEAKDAEIERLRAALEFYADPGAWKKKHDPNDDVRIPDFYSETCFGDTAQAALDAYR